MQVLPNLTFHMPANPKNPVVMLCTGTGIAPFRAFWQQREGYKESELGECVLIVGFRTKAEYLYMNEI